MSTGKQAAAAILAGLPEEHLAQIDLECGSCGWETNLEHETPNFNEANVEALLEHVAFDHITRADIVMVRTTPLLSAYEIGQTLGLDAQTEHEEKWRASQPVT